MNQGQAIHIVNELLPEISRTKDPEGVLSKYASEHNLAPSQLERLGQLFNTAKTISYMDKSATRGGSFSLVDTEDMVNKYMRLDDGNVGLDKLAAEQPSKVTQVKDPYKIPNLWEGVLNNFEKKAAAPIVDPVAEAFTQVIAEQEMIKSAQEEIDFIDDLVEYKRILFGEIHQGIDKIAHAIYEASPRTFADLERDSLASPYKNENALEQVASKMDSSYRQAYIRADITKLASVRVVKDTTGLLKDLEKLEDDIRTYDKTRDILMEKVAGPKPKEKKKSLKGNDRPDTNPVPNNLAELFDKTQEKKDKDTPGDKKSVNDYWSTGDDKSDEEDSYPELSHLSGVPRQPSSGDELKLLLQSRAINNPDNNRTPVGIGETPVPSEDPSEVPPDVEGNGRYYNPTLPVDEQTEREQGRDLERDADFSRFRGERNELEGIHRKGQLDASQARALASLIRDTPSPRTPKEQTLVGRYGDTVDKKFLEPLSSAVNTQFKSGVGWIKDHISRPPQYDTGAWQRDKSRGDVSRAVELQRALVTDPVLKAADPVRVASLYNSLYKANPEMMSDRNVMLAALREATQYDGVMPHTYDQFVSTAKTRAEEQSKAMENRQSLYGMGFAKNKGDNKRNA